MEVVVRPDHHSENRREREIKRVRKELNTLKRRWKKAPEEEKIGLHQLREIMRSKLKHLRKAERLRAGRKMKAERRSQFVKNPYKFTKTLLSNKRSARWRLRSISSMHVKKNGEMS